MFRLKDGSALVLIALPLLVITDNNCDCSAGAVLRSDKEIPVVPRNKFYCENITRGQTWEDWKTRMVELPKQHVDKPDTDIAIDHYVTWPWYLKGMRVSVCNPVGHRPNISWPHVGYSPVNVRCSFVDFPRCPLGAEIYSVQYQSWWPWN